MNKSTILSLLSVNFSELTKSTRTRWINTCSEVTSQNLWSRYDHHFVGITWHIVYGVEGWRFIVLFKLHSIRWFMKMSVWSLARQQSVFQQYHSENIYRSFTHKMAAKASWHQNYVTVILCISFAASDDITSGASTRERTWRELHVNRIH